MVKRYVITGIGTDVGKTIVSAILAEALQASYWKPVQAGDLSCSDSMRVQELTTNVNVLPETYKLTKPMSPHAAASFDNISIELSNLILPEVEGNLIIEGAGGIMVPLNNKGELFIDAIENWNLPTIVVSKHYLGSINHSILTCQALKNKGVDVKGIIFVGDVNVETQSIILKTTGLPMLGLIPHVARVDKSFITEQASIFKSKL